MKIEVEIHEFPRDKALVLDCSHDALSGMEADLVFASGATDGDPVLEKQRAILEYIVAAIDFYNANAILE